MASATPPTPAPTPPPPPPRAEPNEITIVSHSNLFYWWPVWAISLILGVLTMIENHVVAVIPQRSDGTPDVAQHANITYKINKTEPDGKQTESEVKVPDKTVIFVGADKNGKAADVDKPTLHMTNNKTYGVLFSFVLLVVIFITNVPLRGMWSLIIIILMALVILIFAYFEIWDRVFEIITQLDIRFTEGGYFVIGIGLLGLWLLVFLFFDRQIYITVTPGNFKVCTEIGGGEKVYDTAGMKLEKKPSDLFRHWILGMGAGDLIVHTSGAQNADIDLPNVLFIGRKMHKIQQLIKEKTVVPTR